MLHVPGREKLALLDVDRAPGARRGDQQIGLAAEEGGDLQHVDRLRRDRALRALVHVGEHRQAERLADFGEDRQRRLQPDAARAGARGAVGLVERGLEDEADLAPLARSPSAPPPFRAHARGFRAGRGRRSGRAADRRRSAPRRGRGRPGRWDWWAWEPFAGFDRRALRRRGREQAGSKSPNIGGKP